MRCDRHLTSEQMLDRAVPFGTGDRGIGYYADLHRGDGPPGQQLPPPVAIALAEAIPVGTSNTDLLHPAFIPCADARVRKRAGIEKGASGSRVEKEEWGGTDKGMRAGQKQARRQSLALACLAAESATALMP